MYVRPSAFFCVGLSCGGGGFATGRSPVQGVLPVQNRFISFESQILNGNKPEGLILIPLFKI
jgi:hypothetical protein